MRKKLKMKRKTKQRKEKRAKAAKMEQALQSLDLRKHVTILKKMVNASSKEERELKIPLFARRDTNKSLLLP